MSKTMKRALVTLAVLVAFAVVIVLLVANGLALHKEFWSIVFPGLLTVATIVMAGKASDGAADAKAGAESAAGHAMNANAQAERAHAEAVKTDRERKRERRAVKRGK